VAGPVGAGGSEIGPPGRLTLRRCDLNQRTIVLYCGYFLPRVVSSARLKNADDERLGGAAIRYWRLDLTREFLSAIDQPWARYLVRLRLESARRPVAK